MRISIRAGNRTVDLGEIDDYGALVFQVDGLDLFGADLRYAGSAQGEDATGPNEPHINLGWWPDGEAWERLGQVALSKAVPA